MGRPRIPVEGKKYGKWTILKEAGKLPNGMYLYECVCECGEKKTHQIGYLRKLKDGGCKKCGSKRLAEKLRGRPSPTKLPEGVARFNTLYSQYSTKAKERGYSFNLTKDYFRELLAGNCYYCGTPPSNVSRKHSCNGEYVYNGVDRVDNTKGYEQGNVVSCCKFCNRSKDVLSESDFFRRISMIYEKHCKEHYGIEEKNDE